MTIEELTEKLQYVRDLPEEINALRTIIKNLKSDVLSIPGTDTSKEKLPSSSGGKDWTDKVIKYSDLEELLTEYINTYFNLLDTTIKQINKIPEPISRTLLMEYYINRKFWCDVASILYCSESGLYKWRNKALEELLKVWS